MADLDEMLREMVSWGALTKALMIVLDYDFQFSRLLVLRDVFRPASGGQPREGPVETRGAFLAT